MWIHTGDFMNMGTGGDYEKPIKQRFKNKRSTEDNLVGVNNVLTQLIWTQYFLKKQGCEIHDNSIHQDNKSAIKLENNGRR